MFFIVFNLADMTISVQREYEWFVTTQIFFHIKLITPSGWIEHFSNKYIVCGKLVENDAV